MVIPFLRIIWPQIDQVPARRAWDAKGIDLLVWTDDGQFPCAVQCKGFTVQELGRDQLRQVLDSIDTFSNSFTKCNTYIILHNRDGKNAEFRNAVQKRLENLVASGQVNHAELWDRQQLLTRAEQRLKEMITDSLHTYSFELLKSYQRLFSFGQSFVRNVPVKQFNLRFRRYEPCVRIPLHSEKLVSASELVLSRTQARWTLLAAQFGMGKTTTVLHAATSSKHTVVLIECRSLPDRQDQLTSTSLLLEEGLKSLGILHQFSDADQQVLYEVAALTFKAMLKRPHVPFVLIIDGLDENRFYSRLRGMEFLSNQLADLQCPVILTTRLEHLNAMFGDFSSAFQEFSVKQAPKRDARLIELEPWNVAQAVELSTSAWRAASEGEKEHLQTLVEMLRDDSYSSLYGDLPRNPLMLQFIIEDVADHGVRLSDRSSLIESWIKKKIRRDQSRVMRASVGEGLDVEDFTERVLKVMERVAGRMIDPGTHELLEVIDSQEVLDCSAPQFANADLLGLVLNSLLLPVGPRRGENLPLTFAFRVVQEYLLARYLVRSREDESVYPKSIRDFIVQIQADRS
jgi:hypothetical protein